MEVFSWPLFVLVCGGFTIVTNYARGMVCYMLYIISVNMLHKMIRFKKFLIMFSSS